MGQAGTGEVQAVLQAVLAALPNADADLAAVRSVLDGAEPAWAPGDRGEWQRRLAAFLTQPA
jgi:hypothetical protein